MCPKDIDGKIKSVDLDQTLVWVYIFCQDLTVWKLRIIVVVYYTDTKYLGRQAKGNRAVADMIFGQTGQGE